MIDIDVLKRTFKYRVNNNQQGDLSLEGFNNLAYLSSMMLFNKYLGLEEQYSPQTKGATQVETGMEGNIIGNNFNGDKYNIPIGRPAVFGHNFKNNIIENNAFRVFFMIGCEGNYIGNNAKGLYFGGTVKGCKIDNNVEYVNFGNLLGVSKVRIEVKSGVKGASDVSLLDFVGTTNDLTGGSHNAKFAIIQPTNDSGAFVATYWDTTTHQFKYIEF